MTTTEPRRIIPHAPDAESALIGAMLSSRGARHHGLERCGTDDFYLPKHQAVFQAMAALEASESAVDALTVSQATSVPVAELRAMQASSGSYWEEYARIVLRASMARRGIALGSNLIDASYAQDADAITRLTEGAVEALDAGPDSIEPAPDVHDLAEQDTERAWLSRGLLERGDRMILTAKPGWGKSTYLRQLAVQFASGIHPVYRTLEPALRVLHVDVENSPAQSARAYRALLTKAGPACKRGQLFVDSRPHGMNLCARADQRRLEAMLHAQRPDVLVIGPLYKLFRGSVEFSKQSEEAAEQTAAVLDRLRARYRCALLIEAHSPHGATLADPDSFRPRGSKLWCDWPEFGFGMVPVKDDDTACRLHAWRGSRERGRCWPQRLMRGEHWPWESPEAIPPAGARATDETIF